MIRADQLIRAARDLDASARRHKRQAEQHRRAAQRDREKQAEIERQCAALGITVTYDSNPAQEPLHGHHGRAIARPLDANP